MADLSLAPGMYDPESRKFVKPIEGVPTSTTVLLGTFPLGPRFIPRQIRSLQECERTFRGQNTDRPAYLAAKQFFENGGQTLWIISIGTESPMTASPFLKGLSRLIQLDAFNILLTPETINLPDRQWQIVYRAAFPYLEEYRAMYLPPPPRLNSGQPTTQTLVAWLNAHTDLHHANVCLYVPLIQVRSQVNPSNTVIMDCGSSMAGVYARTDASQAVWKAPAGLDAILRGVIKLEETFTPREMTLLTAASLNAIRALKPDTFVAWGARTFSTDLEWKYLPVRRTAMFLESSIRQGLQWIRNEPNGEPLWKGIRQILENFLHGFFRQGAFQGSHARDAFFVKCGRETISTSDQTAGLVKILIGFAPLKPREYIILNIHMQAMPVT